MCLKGPERPAMLHCIHLQVPQKSSVMYYLMQQPILVQSTFMQHAEQPSQKGRQHQCANIVQQWECMILEERRRCTLLS